MVFTKVQAQAQARQLADNIAFEDRRLTYVVVTPSADGTFPFDADVIADGVGAHVKVFRLEDPDLTFALTDRLGKELSVFFGAARVYPKGTAWFEDMHLAPLYLPGPDVTLKQRSLIERALREAYASVAIDDELSEAAELRTENVALRATIDELKHELGSGSPSTPEVIVKREVQIEQVSTPLYRPELFPIREAALRFGVLSAWVRYVPVESKDEHPLPGDYLVGTQFIESFESFDADKREKALRAVSDVLCGIGAKSRDIHVLTAGPAAGPTTRDDGAVCFRAYIERESPSARRLHYWRLKDGTIELSRVVLHDDYAP